MMVLELEVYIENLEEKVARLRLEVEAEKKKMEVEVVVEEALTLLLEEIDMTLAEICYLKERKTTPTIMDLPDLVWLNIAKFLPDPEEDLLSLCYASPGLEDMVNFGLKKSMIDLTEKKVFAVLASNSYLTLDDLKTCAKGSKSWADAAVSSWPLLKNLKARDFDVTSSWDIRNIVTWITDLEMEPECPVSDHFIGADVKIDMGRINSNIDCYPELQGDWNRLLEKCGRFISKVELVNSGLVMGDFIKKVFPNLVQISFTDEDWDFEEDQGVSYWSDITEQFVIQRDFRTLRKSARYQCVNLMEFVQIQLALIGAEMNISKVVIDNAFEGDGHLPPKLMTLTELDLGVGRRDTGCPPFLLRQQSDEAAGRIETVNLRFSNILMESLPELLEKTLEKLWKVRDLTLTFVVDKERGNDRMLQFELPPSGNFRLPAIETLTVCLKLETSSTLEPPDSSCLIQFAGTFPGLKNFHLKIIFEEDGNHNVTTVGRRSRGNRRSFASIRELTPPPQPPVGVNSKMSSGSGTSESVGKWNQLLNWDWHQLSFPDLEKVTISTEDSSGNTSKKVLRLKRKQ